MKCTIEKVIHHNADSGFMIVGLVTQDSSVPVSARNTYYKDRRIHFTGLGNNLPDRKGAELEIEGRWTDSAKYGKQLNISRFMELLPQTREGLVGYLGSGLIKGVGPATAELIVDKFGLDTLNILDSEPRRLLEIRGITEAKLDDIISAYNDSKSLQHIVAFLTPFGISVKKAQKIQEHYGLQALEIVKSDPYRMCEIHGFAFLTVDKIARATSVEPNDPKRIKGAVCYLLDTATSEGHLFLDKDTLAKRSRILLNAWQKDMTDEQKKALKAEKKKPASVTENEVKQQVNALVQEKRLVYEKDALYLPKLYEQEKETARSIATMLLREKSSIDFRPYITDSMKKLGIMLSPKQQEAVIMSLGNPLSVITGGPGTGKTTVLMVILDVFETVVGRVIQCAAPTGLASRKMADRTRKPAQTLHSMLGIVSEEYATSKEDVAADFIVVDEGSMVDSYVAKELFTRVKEGCQLLVVGDADQLPAVGPGKILRDLIECKLVPVTKLDIVYRQANGSRITLNAHRINSGNVTLDYSPEDFDFIPANNPEQAATVIFDLYQKEIAEASIADVQVLSPYKNNGESSVKNINHQIQESINPMVRGKAEMKTGRYSYRTGDKVLHTKNTGEITNGDVGFIEEITSNSNREKSLRVAYSSDRYAHYEPEDMDMLELAYAVTIHKSQGSEYPTVIIPVLYSFYVMLSREIYYTAITRGMRKVILVGQKEAFIQAIRTPPKVRNTRLAQRIINYYHEMTRAIAS